MIRFTEVHKNICDRAVLKSISFRVEPAKITVLCGPNGSGKTTLIRIVLELLKVDYGKVEVECSRSEIGFMFHRNCLIDELSLVENLKFFLGVKKKKLDNSELQKYLKFFNLQGKEKDKIKSFSQGEVKKAELIRVILENPELVILDEPTENLDPVGRFKVRNLLLDWAKASKKTIFLTSHMLDEVEKVADRVLFIKQGQLIWDSFQENILNLEQRYLSFFGNDEE